jgi:hypothetical protein
MKIRSLTICDWRESGRIDTVVEKPSWVEVESAIRAMNNRNLNDVHLDLECEAGVSLIVGVGSGRYIVSGSVAGESFPTLTAPSVADDPHIDLVVGGQLADYPACYVVSLEHALGAIRSVAESGDFGSEFHWTYV